MTTTETEHFSSSPRCTHCGSRKTIKSGIYLRPFEGKEAERVQVYQCKKCGRSFITNKKRKN